MMYGIIFPFYLQVIDKLNLQVLDLGCFRTGYFGVDFDLTFQSFPVPKQFQRCQKFYVTVLSNFLCVMCTGTAWMLYSPKILCNLYHQIIANKLLVSVTNAHYNLGE